MSPDRLGQCSRKQLEHLARRQGVVGIRQLRKQDLIDALSNGNRTAASRSTERTNARNPQPRRGKTLNGVARNRPPRRAAALNGATLSPVVAADEISIDVVDQCWLRVTWSITPATRARAVAALGPEWHQSQLSLRLEDVTPVDDRDPVAVTTDQILPPSTNTWFLRVADPGRTYRIAVGYRGPTGRWHQLIRSRPLVPARTTPLRLEDSPGTAETTSQGEPAEAPATTSTSRSSRSGPAGRTGQTGRSRLSSRSRLLPPQVPGPPPLSVELELVVRGQTDPEAGLQFESRPLFVETDGGFTHRLRIEPGRQVMPIVATASDGSSERTLVLALEINTRELEPRIFDETE